MKRLNRVYIIQLLWLISTPYVAMVYQTPHRFVTSRLKYNESRHLCLGGEDNLKDFDMYSRHCMFKNICYDQNKDKWLYFKGSSSVPIPIGSNTGDSNCWLPPCSNDPSIYTNFNANTDKAFLTLSCVTPIKWTPEIIQGVIPPDYYFIDKGNNAIHIMSQTYGEWPDAIGHIISEIIYPFYHLMYLFGVTDIDTHNIQLVINKTPCPHGKKCEATYELLKSITNMFPLKENVTINFKQKITSNYQSHIQCYERLLVGSGNLHGSSRKHYPDSWSAFTSQVLIKMGLNPNKKLFKQRIIFINKGGGTNGNRIVMNAKDIVDQIQKVFQVEVDYWVWKGETFREEVIQLQNYTVCVSVNGGTSFPCTFLPDGSSNVYLSTWYSESYSGRPGKNNNMEHVTWTWDGRHKTYAYPVLINETFPDRSLPYDKKFKYLHQWKHNKGFVVNFNRLAVLLNDALKYAEDSHELENSFHKL